MCSALVCSVLMCFQRWGNVVGHDTSPGQDPAPCIINQRRDRLAHHQCSAAQKTELCRLLNCGLYEVKENVGQRWKYTGGNLSPFAPDRLNLPIVRRPIHTLVFSTIIWRSFLQKRCSSKTGVKAAASNRVLFLVLCFCATALSCFTDQAEILIVRPSPAAAESGDQVSPKEKVQVGTCRGGRTIFYLQNYKQVYCLGRMCVFYCKNKKDQGPSTNKKVQVATCWERNVGNLEWFWHVAAAAQTGRQLCKVY